jgi:hypothetical protein
MLLLDKQTNGDDIVFQLSENEEWTEKRPSGYGHVCENHMKKVRATAFVLLLSSAARNERQPQEEYCMMAV